mgnify:CR=1 FL=1
MNNLNRFIEIIEDFKVVRDRTQLEVTPDALFSNARALFISENIAQQRNHNNNNFQTKTSEPATEKQIKFLKVLGVEIPNNLTKKQAFLLIQKKTSENEN